MTVTDDSLWIDLVNSDHRDHTGRGRDVDRLDEAPWLQSFLERLGTKGDGSGDPPVGALRELRALLRGIVTSIVEGPGVADADLEGLNRWLARRPAVSRLERDGPSFRLVVAPSEPGPDAATFEVASAFARFLSEADLRRLKHCDNPDCAWVFYDATRSRTRRWCHDDCGNLMKVRRFRARRREHPGYTDR